MESRARSIAPNTSNWRNLAAMDHDVTYAESVTQRDEIHAAESSVEMRTNTATHPLSKEHWEHGKLDRKDLFNAQDLLQYERRKYTEEYDKKPRHLDYVTPRFKLGARVTFCDNEPKLSGSGIVTRVIKPGEKGNSYRTLQGAFDPNMEILYEIDTVASTTPGHKGWIRESMMWKTKGETKPITSLPVSRTKALHPLDHVGIDTCSAVSVSTELADFLPHTYHK
jgi:hypothetical protein